MHRNRLVFAAVILPLLLSALPLAALATGSDDVDLEMVTKIRDEGFRHSKVMEILSELTDRIGPRLTGSPQMKRANEWTRDQFTSWGLVNSHLESWGPFGRGWSLESVSVRMTSPDVAPFYAIPQAWTPGTNGAITAKAIKIKAEKVEDFEKYKGKLAGLIVLNGDMREVKPHEDAEMRRYDEKGLDNVARYGIPTGRPATDPQEIRRRREFARKLAEFFAAEKPAAVIDPARGDGGTLFVQSGGPFRVDDTTPAVPRLTMAIEHYGRVARLLDRNQPVELEVNVATRFYDDAGTQFNTVAEIPGTDKKDELVMLGAHLDSWHSGTGATDNGAGSAVIMEAVRILKALGVKPRRTIRVGLWSGEEQGLLGSRGYVREHFGGRPEPANQQERDPAFLQPRGPLTIKPDQKKVSAYFNVDNGSGKIRGIYCQENAAVRPLFEAWLEPFKDLGANVVSLRNTGGTDHLSFDAVGIPGFQFIQDPLEYDTRTHHSNMDVYERAQRDDMMQAAVILASFVYNAAMREQMMPRKPLPPDEPARPPERRAEAAGGGPGDGSNGAKSSAAPASFIPLHE